MTAGEFFDFYKRLPLVSRTYPTDSRLRAFLRWSKTRPELSSKYPACIIVATAEVNLSRGSYRSACRSRTTQLNLYTSDGLRALTSH